LVRAFSLLPFTRSLFFAAFSGVNVPRLARCFLASLHLAAQWSQGFMADESKPPQSPDSAKPESTGASATPPEAPKSPTAPAAPSAAKPAAPPPKPPVVLQVALNNDLSRRYRERFGAAILDALEDRKQPYLVIDAAQLTEIARYSRDEEKFDLLEDYTAVDWPRRAKRFDLVAVLYSFPHNTRLRLKIPLGANEEAASLVSVWPVANWLEREIFDMFGIRFAGHPDLKRILLPEEWQGHPLRKDYDILKQDDAWVRENLGIESGQ
jgi:NADH-quinone oxidoreductase subunit C